MNTSPPPIIEYRVETQCGRIFSWPSWDMESVLKEVIKKGYIPTFIMEMAEYERMRDEEQRELDHERNQVIERNIA